MRSEWETPATPGTFDFSHVDADDFRDFLEQRSNRFEPVFTTDFHRQIWQVPFGESQIELALDRGQIESRGRARRSAKSNLNCSPARSTTSSA
jgi:triphosphatase